MTCVPLLATTVSVEELPALMEVGLAEMLTVGGTEFAVTVTVAVAVALPPPPVAVAVYVVVAAGLTGCVPPVACNVYVVPSLPVTVTWLALVAATVRVADAPAVMDAGLALMLTVGAL
jgi:hypothetical protein